jgi:hypothetical protein
MASGVRATVALTTRSRKGPHVSCPHDKSRVNGSPTLTPGRFGKIDPPG